MTSSSDKMYRDARSFACNAAMAGVVLQTVRHEVAVCKHSCRVEHQRGARSFASRLICHKKENCTFPAQRRTPSLVSSKHLPCFANGTGWAHSQWGFIPEASFLTPFLFFFLFNAQHASATSSRCVVCKLWTATNSAPTTRTLLHALCFSDVDSACAPWPDCSACCAALMRRVSAILACRLSGSPRIRFVMAATAQCASKPDGPAHTQATLYV